MTRVNQRTRRQMAVFGVITAVTVAYSAVAYLDVGKLVGLGHYDLKVAMEEGGGLYPGSVVTLAGSPVGDVRGIEPTSDGVVATVRLEDHAKIPQDATVEVRSISAAGEQYIDFSAPAADGPFWAAGQTVPAERSVRPIETAGLLRRVNELVASIPADSLNTAVEEVGTGLSRGGEDLETFLDAILPLQETFTENVEETEKLIADAEPVLDTQRATGPQVEALASRLDAFTQELQASDKALRGTLADVPSFTDEVRGLVADLSPELPGLLTNVARVSEVTSTYDASIRQTVTVLPGVINGFQTALGNSPLPGSVSLFARTTVNDPPPCTDGFVQERRSPRDLTPIEAPTSVYCDVPQDSAQAVRGARNYPCPTNARRGPTAASCGLEFQSDGDVAEVEDRALETQVASADRYLVPGAKVGTTPYSPLNGLVPSESGAIFESAPMEKPSAAAPDGAWESLLLGPLGLR